MSPWPATLVAGHARWTSNPQNFLKHGFLTVHTGKIFHTEEGGVANTDPSLNGPGMPYASRPVQLHPDGGQFDSVWLPARTMHPRGGASYVWCLAA